MKMYFAPMEGITGNIYRKVWRSCFGGAEKLFMPFFSPSRCGSFGRKEERELEGEAAWENTVPQLLVNRSENFLWAARALKERGFSEVNLNLGCPSGTVTAKKKGSGALQDPELLDRLLEEIFREQDSIPAVSVKTRLGFREEEEFRGILEIYNRYPIRELIVHARVREDFYRAPVRMNAFRWAEEHAKAPLCYNGDLFRVGEIRDFAAEHPGLQALMLGRGLLVNPALLRELRGGPTLTAEELRTFHFTLYGAYRSAYQNGEPCLRKLKELWFYMGKLFPQGSSELKCLYRARTEEAFLQAAESVFATPLEPDAPISFV